MLNIIVRECLQAPADLSHATYTLSGDNLTASYQCDEGYVSNGTAITSECTSTDPDNVPWGWNIDQTSRCIPGNTVVMASQLDAAQVV